MTSRERMAILERLERGEITPAEAERLLSEGPGDWQPAPTTRMGILEQVENGRMSADEAAGLLLKRASEEPGYAPRREHAEEEVSLESIEGSGSIWKFLLFSGLALSIISGVWMNSILQHSGMNFWFFCIGLPLLAGVALVVLGWLARNSTWLQLKVRSRKSGNRVHISFPLPLNLIRRLIVRRGKGRTVSVNEVKGIEILLGTDDGGEA